MAALWYISDGLQFLNKVGYWSFMKSINLKITALFTIKTSKLNVKFIMSLVRYVILLKSGYPTSDRRR